MTTKQQSAWNRLQSRHDKYKHALEVIASGDYDALLALAVTHGLDPTSRPTLFNLARHIANMATLPFMDEG